MKRFIWGAGLAFVFASVLWCKIAVRSGWLDGALGWQLAAWIFGGTVGICLAQNRGKRRVLSNEGIILVGVVWVAGMDLLVLFGPLSGEAVYAVLGGGSLVLTYVLGRFVGSRSVSAEEWRAMLEVTLKLGKIGVYALAVILAVAAGALAGIVFVPFVLPGSGAGVVVGMAVGAFGGGVAGSRCLAPRAEACYRRFFRWWWGLGDERDRNG